MYERTWAQKTSDALIEMLQAYYAEGGRVLVDLSSEELRDDFIDVLISRVSDESPARSQ